MKDNALSQGRAQQQRLNFWGSVIIVVVGFSSFPIILFLLFSFLIRYVNVSDGKKKKIKNPCVKHASAQVVSDRWRWSWLGLADLLPLSFVLNISSTFLFKQFCSCRDGLTPETVIFHLFFPDFRVDISLHSLSESACPLLSLCSEISSRSYQRASVLYFAVR